MSLSKLPDGPPADPHPVKPLVYLAWTNRFKVEDGQKDAAWQICEYIFSLIKKTHKGFFAAVDSSCNTDRLWVKLANNRLPTSHRAQKRHIQMVDSPLVNDEIVTLNVTDD